ncbi:nitrite reductase [Paramyrothecium foliicola]|nr:nitrite reductase [Paramyrothecium foliicola]
MFYIRTADKLQRTARWLEALPGGMKYLQEVVLEDKLGICASLEAQMQELVDSYFDEWAEAVNNPAIAAKFRQFQNTDEVIDAVEVEQDRGQDRPVYWAKESATEDFKGLRERWTSMAWQPVMEASHFDGADEIPNGISATIKRGDTQLAVWRIRGRYYATQQMCPHKRAFVLSDGLVGENISSSCDSKTKDAMACDPANPSPPPSPSSSTSSASAQAPAPWISCPHHKRNFDLTDGGCHNDESLSIATFPVEARSDGMLYLKLPPVEELDAALGTKRWAVRKGESGEEPFAALDKKINFVGQRAKRPGVKPMITGARMTKPVQLMAAAGGGGGCGGANVPDCLPVFCFVCTLIFFTMATNSKTPQEASGSSGATGEPTQVESPSLEHIHVGVRNCLELKRNAFGDLTYTCRPKAYTPMDQIPTIISGIPVVILPDPYDPIGASSTSQGAPDPFTYRINPGKALEKLSSILEVFNEALGLYIFIDGNIQFIVPPGFDVLRALQVKPRTIGGLQVSYIHESFEPFNSPMKAQPSEPDAQGGQPPPTRASGTKPFSKDWTWPWPTFLDTSRKPGMISSGSDSESFRSFGIVGLQLEHKIEILRSEYFMCLPAHMIMEPLALAKKLPLGLVRVRYTPPYDYYNLGLNLKNLLVRYGLDPSTGGSLDLIPERLSFYDAHPGRYPLGYYSDVALYKLERGQRGWIAPIKSTWLSWSEWWSLKYHDARVDILQNYAPEGERSIHDLMVENGLPSSEGHCQIVGQGFFRSDYTPSKPGGPGFAPVSRSLLFRMHPASIERFVDGCLGSTPIITGQTEDGKPLGKVIGFTSFSQAANTADYAPELGKRRPSPHNPMPRRSAFFGAFIPPDHGVRDLKICSRA